MAELKNCWVGAKQHTHSLTLLFNIFVSMIQLVYILFIVGRAMQDFLNISENLDLFWQKENIKLQ